MDEEAWRKRALCRGKDPKLWQIEEHSPLSQKALAYCNVCPVSEPCLEYALAHETYGIWAGTSHKQRIQIRRERKRENND